MIGTILDKYEVLQKVGEGGMATVYRGRHSTLGRDVAIKVLHPHLSSSTRNRKRFAREARAIEHLRHDNILEIFDYSGEDAEDCYIVTEFVGGRTLSAFMDEQGRLPSEVATIIGIALARALAYAHDASVLHRDLKPDNVMIRFDGTVKLMDFGIARFLDESQVTMTGALVGSPAFMSPEQAREAELDLRSDLFSLGTLLFYLCSGHLPFAGSNPSLILKNIIEGNRPELTELRPSVSPALADIVERLLQTDREARFDEARQVVEHLELALAEVNIDPDDPRWSLCAWLEEPQAYARRLDSHLRTVLLDEGRRLLEAGESLAALRMLNRLLAIDEDNAEVLALVQGLHQEPRRRVAAPWVLAGVAALIAAMAFAVIGVVTGAVPVPGLTPPETGDTRLTATASPATSVAASAVETGGRTDATPITVDPPAPDPIEPPERTPPAEPVVAGATRVPAAPPAGPRTGSSARADARRVAPSQGSSTQEGTAEADSDSTGGLSGAPEPRRGRLRVIVPEGWGKLYINGEPTEWSTYNTEPLEVDPGNFRVMVHHPLAEPLEFDVTVAAGEEVRKEVELTFKPIPVDIPRNWNKRCRIVVGDIDVGSLEEIDYGVLAPRYLDRGVDVELFCPGGPPVTHRISRAMMGKERVTLPGPG